MMVTLGVTMLRGRVWAGGAQREGKEDDRKKSWKVLLVGETGRTWVRQQGQGSVYCSSCQTKASQNANCFPIPLSGVFPCRAAVILKLEGSRVLLRYMVHWSKCDFSTRDLMCLSLEIKAYISVVLDLLPCLEECRASEKEGLLLL